MERTTLFVDVIVPLAVPNKYTYRVPQELNAEVEVGKRVIVQFGKTKLYTGIIWSIHETPPKEYAAKYIDSVLDEQPVVLPSQLKFWEWLSFYYCAHPGEVMNAALPSGLKLQSTSVIYLNLEFSLEEVSADFFSPNETILIDALMANNSLSFEDISKILDVRAPQPIVSRLLKKGAIAIYEDLKERYKPKMEAYIRLAPGQDDESNLHKLLDQLEKKAFRQAEALLLILHLRRSEGQDWLKKADLLKKLEAGALKSLVKKGVLEENEFETGRLKFEGGKRHFKTLNKAQEQAATLIREGFEKSKPVLLHGVTGSGKTEVYIQLIREQVENGKQALLLVPEIALTTQLIMRMRAAFADQVGVYHSRFSENERVEIWNNVLHEADPARKYRIIVGARSALFLPYEDLGLIIVDEEHDTSYKQYDPAPRYHGRDAALYLAHQHGASILLGSATPSLESQHNAETGKYGMVRIEQQYVAGGGTQVEVCDLKYYDLSNQMRASLTPPLYDAIQQALAKKEQVILFQNRRGFAPYTECRQCGFVPHCIQCDVSLIYHKQQQKLICHYCGYSINPPSSCSACGSHNLHLKGLGTEKIEEDIEVLFPEAKIARMDLDSTRSKYAYKQLIDEFESGQTQILIGTQMVTKGLDFGNVSVVGVLSADSILNFPDFRSFERAYQLITQVRGRAGRKDKPGRVLVQTTQPDHHVLKHIVAGSERVFYAEVMQERRTHHYPPFTRLIEISIGSADANELNHLSQELATFLKPVFADGLLGPEFPMVSRIKNLYYKRILLKISREKNAAEVRKLINEQLEVLHQRYNKWKYRVIIDVDPV